ncbi:MAG: heavy-metal-associated domain-containing protein [Deltaproteobacteria bacterium]|nr:heavy-metal-associated domain-containing protein [Deltaproteobacteria bacterium]
MSSQRETLLNVTGMTCRGCARHVEHALRELEGVRAVEVRLREGEVRVEHDGSVAPTELVEALRVAGYDGAPAL